MKTLANPRDTNELLARLNALRPDSVRRWGRMSAHQMVCHLADFFRMGVGERLVGDETTLLTRTFLRWAVLYVPFPWPESIPTRPELDQERDGTRPVVFAADVAEVVALMERFVTGVGFDPALHPYFGRMSRAQWLRFGYQHTDYHLRQFGV